MSGKVAILWLLAWIVVLELLLLFDVFSAKVLGIMLAAGIVVLAILSRGFRGPAPEDDFDEEEEELEEED